MNELTHADEKSVYSTSVHTDPGVLFSAVYTVRITNSGFPRGCLRLPPTVFSQQPPGSCFLPQLRQKPVSTGSLTEKNLAFRNELPTRCCHVLSPAWYFHWKMCRALAWLGGTVVFTTHLSHRPMLRLQGPVPDWQVLSKDSLLPFELEESKSR